MLTVLLKYMVSVLSIDLECSYYAGITIHDAFSYFIYAQDYAGVIGSYVHVATILLSYSLLI